MKNPAVDKTELVIKALDYAHQHKLDINRIDDVKKILEEFQAENENVEKFKNLLQNADAFMEMMAKEKEPKKTKLPN